MRLESGAQASDAFAALQVKKIAKSQGDPKKIFGKAILRFDDGTMEVDTVYEDGTWVKDETLVPDDTPALVQDLQGNEGLPWKIWKIKKIKEALEGRRHPAGTTTTTSTTTDLCFLSSMPDCPSGNFTFAFENLRRPENGNSPGRVTGCISGLSCGDTDFQAATSVRVVSNTAGYGLGEYFTAGRVNRWNVSDTCEIGNLDFRGDGPASGSIRLRAFGRGDLCDGRCAALSKFSSIITPCNIEVKLTFKYNP